MPLNTPLRIVFFGTPGFAGEVLRDLVAHNCAIVGVVTQPDRPRGRSKKPAESATKVVAQQLIPSVPLLQPDKASDPTFADQLKELDADLFVVVAYGEIVKQHILDMPKLGCINLHASLLPKYRGAAPIQRVIMNGEVETGVTVQFMAKKMDAGDIIRIATASIPPLMTYGELETKLCELSKSLLRQVLGDFEAGTVNRTPQNHDEATFAAKILPEDAEIKWNNESSAIHNLIRGTSPRPGAWCMVLHKGVSKRLKLLSSAQHSDLNGKVGEFSSNHPGKLVVFCQTGAVELLQVQLEGKKPMPVSDLLRGIPLSDLKLL